MTAVLELQRLRLRNFKGIQAFELIANGENAGVYGDNGTGKTTLADAFSWLLFGKDSQGHTDFGIKPYGENGEALHNMESEVEGVLRADGRLITLAKVYKEKWSQKRGSARAEFAGHTTDYFIDGVPVKESEYLVRVAEIAPEEAFRLATDPKYFNERVKWVDRRRMLLEACGDVSDVEVITSDPRLAPLPDILNGRRLDDHKKVITARRTKINDELKSIPTRIDEATRALPDVTGDPEQIKAQVAALRTQREAKSAELVRLDNGSEVTEKRRQISEADLQLTTLQTQATRANDQAVQQIRTKLAGVTDQVDAKQREMRRLRAESDEADRTIQDVQAKLAKLREDWGVIKARAFTATVADTCPTCGQALPAEKVQAAYDAALADFNTRRSNDLEANKAQGLKLKGQLDQLQTAQTQRSDIIAKAEQDTSALNIQANELRGQMERLRSETPDPTKLPEYKGLIALKGQLEQEVAELRNGSAEAKAKAAEAIRELDGKIADLEGKAARLAQKVAGLKRITELEEQEKTLTAEFEKLERELYLCDLFTEAQAKLLDERVNSRFTYARFKLTNKLVNGGTEPCCETLFQGVPYSDLNNGARVNIGLDIINTLSQHYRFVAPIWIDNSESVTRLIPTEAQVIRLVVSEPDKVLRVEVDDPVLAEREAV